ncbi:HD-GYP domain-containing protein [Chromobacterium sp. ASV23]|uniref:HD-GYP domain-containing protein n=1 Tax=Chromobacterium sp. ASV23 TaxID=2795110 RepID=UPI0018EA828F|nr:HD domain-containing phosphohydrolase [Chromobacterium sp. ASV23]
MRDHDFTTVNSYWLSHLLTLGEDYRPVLAKDALDSDGKMLLPAGSATDASWMTLLPQRRLQQPLEKLLQLEAFDPRTLLQQRSWELLQDSRFLHALLEQNDGCAVCIAMLKQLPLKGAIAVWLAILHQRGELDHALLVCLVSISLAKQLHLPAQEQQQVALAGLLHDIGKLYIDPTYLSAERTLQPEEWHHVVNHPLLGCQLLLMLGELQQPKAAALAILQHHERLDGSGYPLGALAGKLEKGGQILMLADTFCQLQRHVPYLQQRLDIALKILPGEFNSDIASTLCRVGRQGGKAAPPVLDLSDLPGQLQTLLQQIGRLTQRFWAMAELDVGLSAHARRLLDSSMKRFNTIQRALSNTAMNESPPTQKNEELSRELWCVMGETRWRLRNLARQITLRIDKLHEHERVRFTALIKALMENETPAAPPAGDGSGYQQPGR